MRFHSPRTAVLFGLVALALMANGKKRVAAAQLAPSPVSPSVALSASAASVQAGQQVTLTWSSKNATSITLQPSVGSVARQGSTTVRPSQSTTYTVTATGPGGSAHASAQVTIAPAPPPAAVREPSQDEISSDQQQMRGLDEQIQEIKSDSLRMAAELGQLEEKLLYPSGTQVAIFVELAKGDTMRLDAVRLQIDGQLVAHYIYSAKELQALRKGGVQRIYVGNVETGDHKLDVLLDGKLEGGADFSRTGQFTFRKEVKPKLVGLTLAGPRSGNTPIALGDL
jgi:plastocyanin